MWLWNGRTRSASRMAYGQFGELNNVTDAHFGSQSTSSNVLNDRISGAASSSTLLSSTSSHEEEELLQVGVASLALVQRLHLTSRV